MQINLRLMFSCFVFYACLSNTAILGDEGEMSSCILTNISLPRGNVLEWVACLQQNLDEQHGERGIHVLIDVGLPVISNAVTCADEILIRNFTNAAISNCLNSLHGPTSAPGGIRRLVEPMQIGWTTLEDALGLMQLSFDCQVSSKDEIVKVKFFPCLLVIQAYRLKSNVKLCDWKDMVVSAYGGDGCNPWDGVVCDVPDQGIVFVMAPPDRHDKAIKLLARYSMIEQLGNR